MKKLSIITVTFNAASCLWPTLNSIFDQTFRDFELIVIDGNSTDGTREILKQHESQIRYWVSEPDTGIYDAMNKGLKVATGEYVQFLNAGDTFVDEYVLAQVFSSATSPTLIYGDINILHLDGRVTRQRSGEFTLQDLLQRGTGVLCHQAMFVLRESASAYSLTYPYKAELNWYFDLVELADFRYEKRPIPIVNYALGGFGHRHFVRNRLDWLRVVYDRYGLSTIRDSRLVPFLLKNATYRYAWLGKVHQALSSSPKTGGN